MGASLHGSCQVITSYRPSEKSWRETSLKRPGISFYTISLRETDSEHVDLLSGVNFSRIVCCTVLGYYEKSIVL